MLLLCNIDRLLAKRLAFTGGVNVDTLRGQPKLGTSPTSREDSWGQLGDLCTGLLHDVARGVLHGGMTPGQFTPDQTSEVATLTLGEYVRERRVALDITKSEAARRAGVSRRTWHEVEEGLRAHSTAVTLAQFDQALQLPEGTLYAMTARSSNYQIEALRQRAIDLVRLMTTGELEAFVRSNGTRTVWDAIQQMERDIAELRGERDAEPPGSR